MSGWIPPLVQRDDGIVLLDERGCLTWGAMTLVAQLDENQQAVVDRHVKSCPVCAQQHVTLTVATEWIQRSRPRVAVPVEARLAARQAIVRGLRASHRQAQPRRRKALLWWILHSPTLAGAAIAIVAAATGLLMARLFG